LGSSASHARFSARRLCISPSVCSGRSSETSSARGPGVASNDQ
jgi:hypothetical protein